MKIYYDYQELILQKYGGISRYFYELYTRINKMDNCEVTIKCCHNTNHYFADIFHSEYPILTGRKWTFYNKLNKLITWFELRNHYDIVHPTYYSEYILKCLRKDQKLITTIHDMIHEKFHDQYPEALPTSDIEMKKEMIYKSDHIIAISQSTKKDILKFYPDIPENKITVIYHGARKLSDNNIPFNKDFPNHYVLFVGQRRTYKNYLTFFNAMKGIMDNDKEMCIVCIGGGKFDEEELSFMKGYTDRVLQMDCDDIMLMQAYRQARCFVFPSLYEGFGMPTLEAFENDCPVILSNTSSMPEVGGEAVLYFEPLNENQLKEQIEKVIYDNELRQLLIIKGKERLQYFQWEDKVKEIVDCYNKVKSAKTFK